jgi:hypothetical protein
LFRNPAKVYVPPLQLWVTKRGSKVSLSYPRYKLFLIPFLWQGLYLNFNLGRRQVNVIGLHAIKPFCHLKKITSWIRIQTHFKIRIKKNSNGKWQSMIFRWTLVPLAHLKKYYLWRLLSIYWIEFVLQFLCFVKEKVVLYSLANQTSFLSLHKFGWRCSWLGFWHVPPASNTRILRIFINVCRQGSWCCSGPDTILSGNRDSSDSGY